LYTRFPKPQLDILPLSNGDSITVRRRLTHGETTDTYARQVTRDPKSGEVYVDPLKVGDSWILAYLVDWTIRDEAGDLIPIRGLSGAELADTLRALDHDSALEIKLAIDAHREQQARILAEEKKTSSPVTGSVPISPSPVPVG
jgi:hypothetical protein